jgi:hypothetical protein
VVTTTHQIDSYVHPVQYEIVIDGHLADRWSSWFDGLTIARNPDGTTVLRGFIVDQSALHGLLERLRDIGIPLIALRSVDRPTHEGSTPEHEGN